MDTRQDLSPGLVQASPSVGALCTLAMKLPLRELQTGVRIPTTPKWKLKAPQCWCLVAGPLVRLRLPTSPKVRIQQENCQPHAQDLIL